jgi:hypothetical protein
MKYFTRQWANGELPDEAYDAAVRAYADHIAQLLPRLPKPLAILARDVSLHDALVRCVVVDRTSDKICLGLLCGDLQAGYFDLDVTYLGVHWEALELETLARRARDPGTELLWDELSETSSGHFRHDILFSPNDEVSLEFSGLELRQVGRRDRIPAMVPDRFVQTSAKR